jgi:dienelactone hydrolase
MRHVWLLAAAPTIAMALAQPAAHAQFARQEIISFQSAKMSPTDFLNGKKGEPVNLAGHLRLPKAAPNKQAVVILLHGAGGVASSSGNSSVWADVLNQAGIATFAVDSFAGRGVNTLADVAKVSFLSRTLDAFGALELLAKHPLIDSQRIAVMGFSHGAVAALYSNVERFRKMHGKPDVQFAAHISVYGLCGTQFREDENHIKPVLLLHGIADDFVPIGPCREYTARLMKAGKNVRLIEYPDAHHVFDAPQFGQMTKLPDLVIMAWCRFTEVDNGNLVNAETKKPLIPNDSCWRKGPSLAYHESAAKKAYADVTAFLKDVFEQK